MALSFTLYLSGSPQDYEWLPQTDDHARQVCRQYFDLPSTKDDPPHNSDFYVELFPADKFAYYTYLHRKAVSGVPREGAHLALTMRISGGYCNQPKAIYDLFDMVYMQYVDGKVVQRKGNGEVFIIPSLSSCESQRKQMETALADALQHLVAGTLSEFGKEVSASRQPSSTKYFSADTDNEQLLAELRRTHKLRLIPSTDGSAERVSICNNAIEQLRAQLVQSEGVIQQKNAAIEQLNAQLKNMQDVPVQKKSSNPQGSNDFQRKVLSQLDSIRQQIDGLSTLDSKQKSKPIGGQFITKKNSALLYLPWALLAVAILYITASGLMNSNPESKKERELLAQIETLKKGLDIATNTLNSKDAEIMQLKEHLQANAEELAYIVGSANGVPPQSPQTDTDKQKKLDPGISVGVDSEKIYYVDKSYVLGMRRYDGTCHFEIESSSADVLSIQQDEKQDEKKVYCKKVGSGTIIAFDAAHKEIARRTIAVKPKE